MWHAAHLGPPQRPHNRLGAVFALVLLISTGAWAQSERVRYEFTPRHQSASTLAPSVIPFLSPGGTLELRAVGRTLVVVDTPENIAKVVPLLKHLDRPASAVTVTVRLVRGWRAAVSGEPAPVLPPDLETRLSRLMPGRQYELLSERSVTTAEGSSVGADLGGELWLSFQVGTVLAGRRLRLSQFTLERGEDKTLMRGDVNLWVDRPVALAITESRGADALVLVVEAKVPPTAGLSVRQPAVGGDPARQPKVGGDPTLPRPR